MNAFRIICETCHARLKISSVSVVGEIHACPKCGSMVHVRPPADYQVALSHSDNSASLEIGAPVVHSFADSVVPPIESSEAPAPLTPVASGTSAFVMWAVGGAAILVVGGLVAVMWQGRGASGGDSVPIAEAKAATSTGNEPVVTHHEATPSDEPVTRPDANTAKAATNSVALADPSPIPASLPELPRAEAEPTKIDEPAADVVVELPPPATTGEPSQTSAPAAEETPRAPVMKFDPLDFDPSQLSLTTGAISSATPDPGSIPDDADGEAAGDYVASAAGDAAAEANDDVSLPPPAHDSSLTVRLGPMPSGAPRPHKAAEQLALRVASLDVTNVPLSRFVETLSDLADVPIALDPTALELAGVSTRQSVTVRASDVTVEKLLRDALAKHRLDFVDSDAQVNVTLAGGERRRAVDYEVADLIGESDGKQFASLIQRFVAPATWDSAGGSGSIEVVGAKLRIDHNQSVRHEALIFCERLRLARGLASRSQYPAKLLSVQSPYETIASKLNQRTTFTFLPWSRLTDVVRHWQETSGLTILVDWSALAELELGPSAPIACSAIDRTWEESLDGILVPLGLAWWVVDGETIQITSRETVGQIQRIEFYTVPKAMRNQFASNVALVESLQKDLPAKKTGTRANSEHPRLELDETSGRLIVRGAPESHRYLNDRLSGRTE